MTNKPSFPTINQIRSSRKGELDGYAVAEAFDQVSKFVGQLHDQISSLKPAAPTAAKQTPSQPVSGTASSSVIPTTAPPFSLITTGVNTGAVMVVGAGASLDFSGAGIINASKIGGVSITGTPVAGYIPIATSPTAATWTPLGMITSLDCMSTTGLIGGLDCGKLS